MSAREVFFADAAFGQRFCIVDRPLGQPRGQVLLVPPLLEELNKSRRMCALAARALADAGLLVLRMDLHGCGDSSGDLADASWVTWIADVEHSAAWLRSQADGPLFIWAVRGGALLAGDWLARGGGCDGLMLWHPVLEGRRNLVQLLRLAAVAHWQDEHKAGASASALLARLEQGAGAEVAGYVISPKLAKGVFVAARTAAGFRGARGGDGNGGFGRCPAESCAWGMGGEVVGRGASRAA